MSYVSIYSAFKTMNTKLKRLPFQRRRSCVGGVTLLLLRLSLCSRVGLSMLSSSFGYRRQCLSQLSLFRSCWRRTALRADTAVRLQGKIWHLFLLAQNVCCRRGRKRECNRGRTFGQRFLFFLWFFSNSTQRRLEFVVQKRGGTFAINVIVETLVKRVQTSSLFV